MQAVVLLQHRCDVILLVIMSLVVLRYAWRIVFATHLTSIQFCTVDATCRCYERSLFHGFLFQCKLAPQFRHGSVAGIDKTNNRLFPVADLPQILVLVENAVWRAVVAHFHLMDDCPLTDFHLVTDLCQLWESDVITAFAHRIQHHIAQFSSIEQDVGTAQAAMCFNSVWCVGVESSRFERFQQFLSLGRIAYSPYIQAGGCRIKFQLDIRLVCTILHTQYVHVATH